ncbi:MAG: radical SAM protein [bacterium]
MDYNKEFYSCSILEDGLSFDRIGVTMCCCSFDKSGEGIIPYNGGELPIQKILERKEKIRQLNQTPERSNNCRGCGNLTLKKWRENKYLFNKLTITHTAHCQLKCFYCYNSDEGFVSENFGQVYNLFPVIKELYENKQLSPDSFIFWGGGEPTILKEFEELIDFFNTEGNFRQRLNTNGVKLSEYLSNHPLKEGSDMTCSVDSATRETYHKIKGVDCSDKVWSNLEKYAKLQPAFTVKYIVMQENLHEVELFAKRAKSIGIKRVMYDLNHKASEQNDEVINAVVTLIRLCNENGIITIPATPGLTYLGEKVKTKIENLLK